jgi:cytochrome c biogenesis protein CcdA
MGLRQRENRRSIPYAGLILGTGVLALAGYLGYVVYPRFDLPAGRGTLLLALAAGAGIASFFSPCSFLLLVTMLARPLTGETADHGTHDVRRALAFATALSLGATAFLLLTGTLMALGADALFEDVKFTSPAGRVIRGAVGALLIVLGLIQLNVLRFSFRTFEPTAHAFLGRQTVRRTERPMLRFYLFGFGYLLAGFG